MTSKASFPLILVLAAVAFMSPFPLRADTSPAGSVAHSHDIPVCVVAGVVREVEKVKHSPWGEALPTTLTVTEVRIHIDLDFRAPQTATRESRQFCLLSPEGDRRRVYKLCSPTSVRAGNRIQGTEGIATGAAQALGCLFDVAVADEKERASPP